MKISIKIARTHSIKKVLLYAPTYRGDADKAYIPEKLDIKALKENFGSEWVLLVKRHGFVKKGVGYP
ncbi:CDP-glycerol glycerophosphotransferase family protein [Ruminococcus sp.]|uniref:CDP-glycerol glycerophosphotransferase family protein n=1 Tax=Ruminococcus sp. TaxID=41978 RepID=UPI00399FFFFD